MDGYRESPFNRIPALVLVLVLAVLGIELVLSAASNGLIGGPEGVGWRLRAYQDYAFSTRVWNWMIDNRQFPTEHLMRLVTYPFLHPRFFDALLAGAFLLALGKGVSDALTPWAVAVIFVGASIAGAVAYGTFVDTEVALSSAYTPCFGLVGAITYVRWLNLHTAGASQIMAFRLIGVFMLFRLVWGVVNLIMGYPQDMQWVAELTGFATGFLLTFAFEPKGWHLILAKFRSR
jgi:membrane associated rhomboid family serine protease